MSLFQKMREHKAVSCIIIIVAIVLAVLIAVGDSLMLVIETALSVPDLTEERSAVVKDDPDYLNVALYPEVPNMAYMEKVCKEMYAEIAPEVTLNFVDWNCYYSMDPENIDVFMYDAVFLNDLYERGYLTKLDLKDYTDVEGIMPFTLKDTQIDGECYGMPALICSYFLFYRNGDQELAAVENVDDLYRVLGDARRQPKPRKNEGLICRFGEFYPYYYESAMRDDADEANWDIMGNRDKLNPNALKTVNEIYKMCGPKQAFPSTLTSVLMAKWYNDGYGRAYYGVSEELSTMQENVEEMNLKFISLGNGDDKALFYTDLLSINANTTDPQKVENCEKLIDLLTSYEYIYKISLNEGKPVYMLPAREKVYSSLGETYPKYLEIEEVLNKADKHVSVYEAGFNEYMLSMYDVLAEQLE